MKASTKNEHVLTNRFIEEYEHAAVALDINEKHLMLYFQEVLPDWQEVLPDWWVNMMVGLEFLWVMISVSINVYFFITSGFSWHYLLIIPGLAMALLLSTFIKPNIITSLLLLSLTIFTFPHYLGLSLGFYGFLSLTKATSIAFAKNRLKRLALGCDENFLLLLKKGSIKIATTKYAKESTLELLKDIESKISNFK